MALSFVGQLVQAGWNIETADPGGVGGASINIDSLDGLGISYLNVGDDLLYAQRIGSAWSIEVVDTDFAAGGSSNGGGRVPLVFDSVRQPHIAYIGNGLLKHAKRINGTWVTEAVPAPPDQTDQACDFLSMAIDSSDGLHISCVDDGGGTLGPDAELTYARWDGAVWTTEVLDFGASGPTAIVVDSADKPRILYSRPFVSPNSVEESELRLAMWTGTAWVLEKVDISPSIDSLSMDIDAADNLHAGYFGNDMGFGPCSANDPFHLTGSLKYAKRAVGSWSTTTVRSCLRLDEHPWTSIVLNSSGVPHISFMEILTLEDDSPDFNLNFAKLSGTTWFIESVDTAGDVGEYTAMVLDSLGTPHIAYHSLTDSSLKYASQTPSITQSTTVVNGQAEVSIRNLSPPDITIIAAAPAPGTIALATSQGLQLVSNVFDLGPDGAFLAPPAAITFRFDPLLVTDTTTVAIYRFDGVQWSSAGISNQVVLNAPDPRVTGELASFSLYALFMKKAEPPAVAVLLDLDPDTLNLKSQGQFLTAFLEATGNKAAPDIVPATLRVTAINDLSLSSSIPALARPPSALGDHDGDGIADLAVKFDRGALAAVLPVSEQVKVTVAGSFLDGSPFVADDFIRTILPGRISRSAGGLVAHPGQARVHVPAGALPQDLDITILKLASTPAQDEETQSADAARKALQRHGRPFQFSPEGTRFSSPVTITLPYDPLQLAAAADEEALRIAYWNPQTQAWEPMVSRVDKAQRLVSAQTAHFSVYQVVSVASPQVVTQLSLVQVYAFPNPVRGRSEVTIRVQPGPADLIQARVYDVSGRRVHQSSDFRYLGVFDDGNGQGPQHTFDHVWDVSGIGSGVYTYVVTARKAGQAALRKTGKIGIIK